jgi:hypothetical protein
MSIDRIVMAWAGGIVLLSILLSFVHSSYWLLLTAFVGINLLQSAFTGFLPDGHSAQKARCQIRSCL